MVAEYKWDRIDQEKTKLSLNYSFCFMTVLYTAKEISRAVSIFKRVWYHYEREHDRPAENIYCDSDWLITKWDMGNNEVCIYPIHYNGALHYHGEEQYLIDK